ncbi:MAG: hypothetical protein II523_04650 [Bacteroidales bacterium]|nr:hypothetical protein [Bacteroidales bacterium]
MKKTLFFMIILAIFATGCKKDKKSKSLNYNDSNPIVMPLSGPTTEFDHKIQVTSDYDITYTAINNSNYSVVSVSNDGYIHGKNVGSAKVGISNGYENLTIDVNVDLFIEPTFEFGCSPSHVRDLYGAPINAGYNTEGNLVYQYTTNHGYSYACGEMDFFFNDGSYYESDVYIRPSVEFLLDNYLTENFDFAYDVQDTISPDTIITVSVYKNKLDEDIICGKRPSLNQWNEILLFYFRHEDTAKDIERALYIRPRSSKLRY